MAIKIDVDSTNEKVVESLGFTCSNIWKHLWYVRGVCRIYPRFDWLFISDKYLPTIYRETDMTSKASILSTINYTVLELTSLLLEEADT